MTVPEYSSIREVNILKGGSLEKDYVIAEEPLEMLLSAEGRTETVATTMRTPGADAFLALGYFRSEGLLNEVLSISRPESCEPDDNNRIIITQQTFPKELESMQERRGIQSSSCGLCGKVSVESVLGFSYPERAQTSRRWEERDLLMVRGEISKTQPLFSETGGSHGVWLFNEDNDLVVSYEDVGRHNALDKLLGWAQINKPFRLENMTLILSSRLSYELVHKAAVLGVSVIGSVGAPTSLAVELSNALEISAVGFLNTERFNLYGNKKALIFGE